MLFQILDNKEDCFGIYADGEFIYDRVPHDITGTWNWHPSLSESAVDYASIYMAGKSLAEICPQHLQPRLQKREQPYPLHWL